MATRLTIDPITRIEGHLRIDVEVDGGKVKDAWASCTMWRGIENILLGRDPREAWLFTQRFCGVCTTVHAIASVRAVEDANRDPHQDQPGHQVREEAQDLHVQRAPPHEARAHQHERDGPEAADPGLQEVQTRQDLRLPQRVHLVARQQHQRPERGLVHHGHHVGPRDHVGIGAAHPRSPAVEEPPHAR